jgi:hypothetical protein
LSSSVAKRFDDTPPDVSLESLAVLMRNARRPCRASGGDSRNRRWAWQRAIAQALNENDSVDTLRPMGYPAISGAGKRGHP